MSSHSDITSVLTMQNDVYARSASFAADIGKKVSTFHHHFHIVWPLLESIHGSTYVEIGCYGGASLMTALQCESVERAIAVDTFAVGHDHLGTVKKNLAKHLSSSAGKKVTFMQGSSHSVSLLITLYRSILSDPACKGIDVLFIDGDHSYGGVIEDFKYFSPLTRSGSGIIVFDDYADKQWSPEVKPAVDAIALDVANTGYFCVIGQVRNDANAFGNGLVCDGMSNEFLLQKSTNPIDNTNAKYIICIATYWRSNKTTEASLRRLLASVMAQTNQDWFVVVVGDRYEDQSEFDSFQTLLPHEKSFFINLPIAAERDDASFAGRRWLVAGSCAMNYALMLCQSALRDCVYVHADDDDVWLPTHLASLDIAYSTHPEAAFVWTMGMHNNGTILPHGVAQALDDIDQIIESVPICSQTLHSAVSWQAHRIPLRYNQDAYKYNMPADGDMWNRIAQFIREQSLQSFLVRKVTMYHPTESM